MTPVQPTFRALADPTRRSILQMLSHDQMTIAEVAGHFDMTRAAVKKHLTVLSDAGLVKVTVRGRERVNSFNPAGMQPIRDWMSFFDTFWDTQLDALKQAIEKDTP